jgi:hypothetical protein
MFEKTTFHTTPLSDYQILQTKKGQHTRRRTTLKDNHC